MSDLEDAIELARIGTGKQGYRSYPGTGGIWAGEESRTVLHPISFSKPPWWSWVQ
jgi:hypothetical protein